MPKKSKSGKNKSKSKSKGSPKSKKVKVEPIPKGFRTVTPYLTLNRASEALDWYKKAFGAKQVFRENTPDGKIIHARVRIGDSIIMLSDDFMGGSGSEAGAASASKGPKITLHVYSKNVDKLWQQAVDNGAKVVMPIANQYWGERYGQLSDPYGHNWSVSQQIAMTRQERKEKQEQAMAMMNQGQRPGEQEEGARIESASSMTQE